MSRGDGIGEINWIERASASLPSRMYPFNYVSRVDGVL